MIEETSGDSIWATLDNCGEIHKLFILIRHTEWYCYNRSYQGAIVGDRLWNFGHSLCGARDRLDPARFTLRLLIPTLKSRPRKEWHSITQLLRDYREGILERRFSASHLTRPIEDILPKESRPWDVTQKAEAKVRRAKWAQRPEVKVRLAEYERRPEVKTRRNA
jgi:hypothetical protein